MVALAFGFVIMFMVFSRVHEEIRPMLNDSTEAAESIDTAQAATGTFDYVFLGVVLIFIMVSIGLAAVLPTHPLFTAVYIIVTVIGLLAATIGSNMYETLAADAVMVAYSAEMPIISLLMQRLPLIFLVTGICMLIVTYAKGRSQQGGGIPY
jgi:hypothetical protein